MIEVTISLETSVSIDVSPSPTSWVDSTPASRTGRRPGTDRAGSGAAATSCGAGAAERLLRYMHGRDAGAPGSDAALPSFPAQSRRTWPRPVDRWQRRREDGGHERGEELRAIRGSVAGIIGRCHPGADLLGLSRTATESGHATRHRAS